MSVSSFIHVNKAENYEDTLMLSANTSVEDIEEWLGQLGL